ncbi:hypothetical protein F5Y16DRAFT_82384 [Xylariaceae sp. FL0255]|nr:hypothetical protein F5Y16DRAFT_82384 [Xylariaceae sp. FL0255]
MQQAPIITNKTQLHLSSTALQNLNNFHIPSTKYLAPIQTIHHHSVFSTRTTSSVTLHLSRVDQYATFLDPAPRNDRRLKMDPPTKRRRLVQQEHSHIDLSDRACRLSPTHRQLGNSFEGGYGVQNSGHLEFGRDFIINVNQQSSTNTDHDRYQVLLDSLRFEHMDERRLGVQKAHAHTCRWFLNSPEYVSWAEAHVSPQNDFLWIKGKPGAGKSTIMKFLLDQIRHQVRNSPNREILISFFFNARGHDLERTTLGLYRSLLFQLLESHPEILPVMNFVRIGHSWTVDSLQAVLHDAIHGLGDDSVCFLIDALDECPITQVRDMVQFFSSLTRDAGRVRTCFASRHYPHITIPTSLSVILETQGGHSNDIVDYLDQRLHIGRGDLQEQIRQGLKEKASGVFMWVVLVVDILNSEYDAGNIHILQKRAQQLPGNLHDLFLDILTRDGQPTEANLLCIQWVLFTQQPLTPRQLYFAILSGAEPDQLMTCHSADVSEGDVDRYILHNSMGLAESTRSKNPTIQFIHESVRDFLLKNEGISRIWPRLSENLLGQSHEALKKCCLTYINMEGLTNDDAAPSEASLSSYPFLEMASHGVLYHAERAQTLGIDQQGFMAVFPRSLWIKHHNMFEQYKVRRYTPEASLLYILAEAGMPALIAAHVERQSCFRVENERYGLPILAASAIKSDDTVEAMLQLQAERLPGLSFTEFYSNLPSGLDSSFGPGRNFIFKRDKALFHQLVAHGNEKSSLFFLNTEECDIHQKDNQGRTALMCAMQRGFDYLVVSLLQKGAEIPIKAENRETPLLWSLSNRHFKIARLLLESSCDISTTNKDGQTPLHCSILNRDTDIAKLLIERGSNVSAVNRVGDTPLHEASRNRFIDIVNLLIGRGCDVSAVNKIGVVMYLPPMQTAIRHYIRH